MAARVLAFVAVALLSVLLVVSPGPSEGVSMPAAWRVIDLGPMSATNMNERGEVAGTVKVRGGPYTLDRAAVWANGRTRELGVLRSLGCGLDMPGMSFATDINGRGAVVGRSYCEANAPSYSAFVWEDGKMTDLRSAVYFNSSSGPFINDRGQILIGREGTAVLWQSGKQRVLAPLRGRSFTEVVALTEGGAVIGNAYPREDEYQEFAGASHAFLWRNGKSVDLGTVGEKSNAIDINERGQVVAYAFTANADFRVVRSRAFLWQDGRTTTLGGLGGKATTPTDINDRGEIVGSSTTRNGTKHAFLWQHGQMTDLKTLPGGTSSTAAAINNRGQVVGTSHSTVRAGHAFLWQQGKMIDLGTLPGGASSAATAITEQGEILGTSTTKNGAVHAVIWRPVGG